MEDKDKEVVSQFEFAINEIVDPEAAKKMRPINILKWISTEKLNLDSETSNQQ